MRCPCFLSCSIRHAAKHSQYMNDVFMNHLGLKGVAFLKYRVCTMKRVKVASRVKAKQRSSVSPCISTLPRHRLVELLWSFAPAYQRWSESLLVEKGLSPQRLRILGSIHERGPGS
jgi:hypothetical protein